MTSVLDLWRWLEPGARLVSGEEDRLSRPVRGVGRTRAAPPHLPPLDEGHLLVVDSAVVAASSLEALTAAVAETELDPAALWVAGAVAGLEATDAALPILVGEATASEIERRAVGHLEREREELAAFATELRLAAAEAALADPQPSAPAGVVAARLRRGIGVSVGGALVSLNPRPAGRALATRFAAAHGRLVAARTTKASDARRTRDGLWLLERSVSTGGTDAVAWLFDDLPLARVDEVALDALAITLRALLRRQPAGPPEARSTPRLPPSTGDPLRDTLLAVARANGRVTPAARALGVHRNTVLYRLRRASVELGIDPRRPDDALRLLEEARPAT